MSGPAPGGISPSDTAEEPTLFATSGRYLSWGFGLALVVALTVVVLRGTEERTLAALLGRARPWWLGLAFLLQAGTYFFEALQWRAALGATGERPKLRTLFRLSFGKLFIDQFIPTAGISGTVLMTRALETRGIAMGKTVSAAVVDFVSYHLSFALVLAIGIAILWWEKALATPVTLSALGFFLALILVWKGLTRLARNNWSSLPAWIRRIKSVTSVLELLSKPRAPLTKNGAVMAKALCLQTGIFALDALTLWALLRGLDVSTAVSTVFLSYIVSSLARILGIVPAGLGIFESVSVAGLALLGVPPRGALAGTLLFRGLTFWLPLVPGLWIARRETRHRATSQPVPRTYWSKSPAALFGILQSGPRGLTREEAKRRLWLYGRNEIRETSELTRLRLFLRQLESPLVLLLVSASLISLLLGDWKDSLIVLVIILVSTILGFLREYAAETACARLRSRIELTIAVRRSGKTQEIPAKEVVPGDVLSLSAGTLIPADGILLEATHLFVDQAVLTGESLPVERKVSLSAEGAPIAERQNCVFMGTSVRSGEGVMLAVATGQSTNFGSVARKLALRSPETDFERGLRHFGNLLVFAMLILVFVVFAINVLYSRPPVESLLFSLALAVGMSPELLPAILSVNLSASAQNMAKHGVLVRRLNAIENLGSMDVLCTDKTGTLTKGVIDLTGAFDWRGIASQEVALLGAINAKLQSGFRSPLDEAILKAEPLAGTPASKVAEIPFDFVRKRVGVIADVGGRTRLIVKGALEPVLGVCAFLPGGASLEEKDRAEISSRYETWGKEGTRVLGVAYRDCDAKPISLGSEEERDLTFAGFLTFTDEIKEGMAETISELKHLGVSIKIITGDNKAVSAHVASLVGLPSASILTGEEIDALRDEALWHAVENTHLFVQVDPNQKERILLALKKRRHVVGFMGDGINDAPAMHSADTSISVDQAVDVARASADFVLLEKSLSILRQGIIEGRTTFANTLKYILTTSSANLGNMISMAAASLFMPFLPLLPRQILLNNFLSDVPAFGIAGDSVDPELISSPRRWDLRLIRNFMIEFGLMSSLFDFLTFAALLLVFKTNADTFRTAWFVESLLTELVIALVVRTQRVFFRSRPGSLLLGSSLAVAGLALALPYLPLAEMFGFVPLSYEMVFALIAITALYVGATEVLKAFFFPGRAREKDG